MYLALTVAEHKTVDSSPSEEAGTKVLSVGNDDLPEDDDNASVVEGVVGDIESNRDKDRNI